MPKPLSLPDFDIVLADSDLPDFDETLASADADASNSLKTAPKSLPALPKPRVPGLNPGDQGPLDVATPWGKPDSFVGKATKPVADAANWMSEGMVSGPVRAMEGFKAAASRDPQLPVDKRLQGMADVLEGGMEAARPLAGPMVRSLPGLLKNAPKLTSAELAVGMGGPPIVKEALTSLGAPEGASNLAAAVTGAVPLGGLAKKSLTPEPKSVYTKAASEVPPPGTPTETLQQVPPPAAPRSQPRSQPTVEIVESSSLITPVPGTKLNSRQRRAERRNLAPKGAPETIEDPSAVVQSVPAPFTPIKKGYIKGKPEVRPLEPPSKRSPAEVISMPVATEARKYKTPFERLADDIFTDESGQLDIDKLFDVVKGAKERLFPTDPLLKRAEELKDAGKIATGAHEAYKNFIRSTHPAWMLQDAIMGKKPGSYSSTTGEGLEALGIPLEKQPAARLESMSGTLDKIDMNLETLRKILYPYRDVFKDKEALQYGIRERHVERGAHPFIDKDGKVTPYKLPGGETLAQNAQAMKDFEAKMGPDRMKRIHEGWERYRTYSSWIFTKLMHEGVVSRDFYDNAMRDNQKFVPFQRLEFVARELDNNSIIPVGRKATAVGEREFQNFMKGSEAEILDPMQGIVRNTIRAERAIASNQARKALADLKDIPEARDWIIEVGADGKPKPRIGPNGQRVIPGIPMGFQPVSYLVDGKKHQVLVPKDVAEIYSSIDKETANMVTNMMGYFSNWLRVGVTSYPKFWWNNMKRDYFTALHTMGLDPIAWGQGMVASVTRDIPSDKVGQYFEKLGVSKKLFDQFTEKTGFGNKLYDDYRSAGAGHSGAFSYSSLPMQANRLLESKTTKALRSIADPTSPDHIRKLPGGPFMQWGGQSAELIPRLGVHRTLKKEGKSSFEAGFGSRNSTINFAIGGAKMDQMYKIQAFLKGRTGASRTGIEYTMKHPGLSALRLGIGLGMPGASLYYANVMQYPEVWDSVDDDIKRNHVMYIAGDGKDAKGKYNQIYSIRLDGITAAFYGAMIGTFETVRGADLSGWLRNGIQTVSDMLPVGLTRKGKFSVNEVASAITPTPLSALYTLGTGEELYTGKDLEKQPGIRQDAAPEERYNLDAKTPMVDLAKGLKTYTGVGVSPHVLEHVPRALFGHWGKFATESLPTVEGDGKTITQRMGDALKFDLRGDPLPSKRELELDTMGAIHGRGNRFQDYTREAELILKKAQTAEDYRDLSQSSLQSLIAKYPDRPPAKIAEEFRDLQKRLNEAKRKNFSGLEKSLHLAPAEARAELIMDALRQMPEAKRASTWKTWTEKGIISSSVRRELRLLEEKSRRQQSAPTVP